MCVCACVSRILHKGAISISQNEINKERESGKTTATATFTADAAATTTTDRHRNRCCRSTANCTHSHNFPKQIEH